MSGSRKVSSTEQIITKIKFSCLIGTEEVSISCTEDHFPATIDDCLNKLNSQRAAERAKKSSQIMRGENGQLLKQVDDTSFPERRQAILNAAIQVQRANTSIAKGLALKNLAALMQAEQAIEGIYQPLNEECQTADSQSEEQKESASYSCSDQFLTLLADLAKTSSSKVLELLKSQSEKGLTIGHFIADVQAKAAKTASESSSALAFTSAMFSPATQTENFQSSASSSAETLSAAAASPAVGFK